MLYDHIVHAAYVHAFSFLLLFVFMLLAQFTPMPGLLPIYTLILLMYLPASAYNMFQRSTFKSVLTAYSVGALYTFTMIMILSFLIAFSLKEVVLQITDLQTPILP